MGTSCTCIIAKYIQKTIDNLYVQDIYQHYYKVDDITSCLLIVIMKQLFA